MIEKLLDKLEVPVQLKTGKLINNDFIKRVYVHENDIEFVCVYKKKNSFWPFSESFYLKTIKIFHHCDLVFELNSFEVDCNLESKLGLNRFNFTELKWTNIKTLCEI